MSSACEREWIIASGNHTINAALLWSYFFGVPGNLPSGFDCCCTTLGISLVSGTFLQNRGNTAWDMPFVKLCRPSSVSLREPASPEGKLQTVEKPLTGFSDKFLQSAARTPCSPMANNSHTCSLRCIFCQVHAPTENDLTLFADFRRQTLRGFLLLLFVNEHIQRVERVGEAADALDEAAGHCFFPVEHAADVRGEVLRVHHQAQKLVAPDA